MKVVADASTLLLPALSDDHSRAASARTTFLHLEARHCLAAPAIVAWEIGNVVHRKYPRAFGVTAESRASCVAAMLLGIELVAPDPAGLARTGALAETERLTFYDAAYLELAARDPRSILVTEDGRLLAAARNVLGSGRAEDMAGAAREIAEGRW